MKITESFSRCPLVETYESIHIKVPFEVVWGQQWLFSLCSLIGIMTCMMHVALVYCLGWA